MEPEVDNALHMVAWAFLEGEARALSETSEAMKHDGIGTQASGFELWHLPRHTCDCSSDFNVTSVLAMMRGMQTAEKIKDVVAKMTTLDRVHQQLTKQEAAFRDPEFLRIKSSGIQMHPFVSKPQLSLRSFRTGS